MILCGAKEKQKKNTAKFIARLIVIAGSRVNGGQIKAAPSAEHYHVT
jgi:hypothetical protein